MTGQRLREHMIPTPEGRVLHVPDVGVTRRIPEVHAWLPARPGW